MFASDQNNSSTEPDNKIPPVVKKGKAIQGMTHVSSNFKGNLKATDSPFQSMMLILAGIILANVIAMTVIQNYSYLPYGLLILLDITILSVIIIPWLYYFSIRPLHLQIQQRQRSEKLLEARLRIMEYANDRPIEDLLVFALDEIESLTGSTIGFFHFFKLDHKTISLQAWSTNTQKNMCKAEGKGSHYDLDQAGVWADAIRQKSPIIHNDYSSLEERKGLPEGHAQVVREMVVPIMRNNKVVAILGLGNKPKAYTVNDLAIVSTFADFAWDVIGDKQAEAAIHESEEKFRTLVDWTFDWELWVNPQSKIIYCSPSCEKITGYSCDEIISNPDLMHLIVHPDDRQFFDDHQKINHDAQAGPTSIEYRIINRDGSEHWIEHICRPLYGEGNQHLGRRVSNRDISLRKYNEKKMLEQKQKEMILTQSIRSLQAEIGRDLHDTLGNHISFLRMNLEFLSESDWINLADIKQQLQIMTQAANESYEIIRAMLAVLQTEDIDDPISLFNNYAEQISNRAPFQCEIYHQGEIKPIHHYQIRQLFYIFREALGNTEKYANASQVIVEFIWKESTLTVIIWDNGTGFDIDTVQKTGHYGLKFMRDRTESLNGTFNVNSVIGEGTKVTVEIPYEFEPVFSSSV
jgi:PAS domain S-box-containing protein